MLSVSNLSNILRFRCKDKQIFLNEAVNSQQNAILDCFNALRLLKDGKIAVKCDFFVGLFF